VKYALAAALLASLVACEKDQKVDESKYPSGPEAPAVIEVKKAGGAQARVLRLEPAEGTRQVTDMAVTMSGTELPGGGMDMTMEMTTVVTETRPDGDFVFELEITDASMSGAMGGDLGNMLEGMKMIQTMSARGDLKEVRGAGSLAGADQLLSQSMNGMQFAFPEDKVGVGSTWQMRTVESQQGMKIYQTVTFEVKKLEGNVVTLGMTLEQKASDQDLGGARLERLTTKGGGEMVIDLTKPVPVSGKLGADMNMKVEAGGESQTVDMKMSVDLSSK
jgi:hypothetical protein